MNDEQSMKVELMPCPFCLPRTDIPKKEMEKRIMSFDDHVSCECGAMGPFLTNGLHAVAWNNAYCWKEIERLKSVVKHLEESVKKYEDETEMIECLHCGFKVRLFDTTESLAAHARVCVGRNNLP